MREIKLKWLDLNRTGQGYKIYRSDTAFDVELLPSVYVDIPLGTSNFTDNTGIEFGGTYYYMISSVDESGNETFSELITVVCNESIYGINNAGHVIKYSFDGVVQWRNTNFNGQLQLYIDCDINGYVYVTPDNSFVYITPDGMVGRINSHTPSGVTYTVIIPFLDGRVGHLSYSNTSSNSTQVANIYDSRDGSQVVTRSTPRYHEYFAAYPEKEYIVQRDNRNNTINMTKFDSTYPAVIWSNETVNNLLAVGAFDSIGYLYVASTGGTIYKFFPDPDDYGSFDPALWIDDTTFSGKTINRMYTDRQGNLLVCSIDGKMVKYSTDETTAWDITLPSNTNDFKVQYDGNIIVATDDAKLIRVDGSNGTIMNTYDLDSPLMHIAIDPGLTHIQRGSIIDR